MNQRAQVLKAIEDFLFEVCLLVVFYPWYLFRLLFRPAETLREYRDAVHAGTSDELVVSAPLFLFISAGIVTFLMPPVELEGHRLFAGVAQVFSSNATLARIGASVAPILQIAICNALIIEWRTPGGVTRASFQLPLFLSILVASVLLFAITGSMVIMQEVLDADGAIGRMLIGFGGALVGFAWFVYAQSRVFMIVVKGSTQRAAIGCTVLALVISEAISALLMLTPQQ